MIIANCRGLVVRIRERQVYVQHCIFVKIEGESTKSRVAGSNDNFQVRKNTDIQHRYSICNRGEEGYVLNIIKIKYDIVVKIKRERY